MSKLENAVPGYKNLIVEPYTPNIGAVIHDFDLGNIQDEPRLSISYADRVLG